MIASCSLRQGQAAHIARWPSARLDLAARVASPTVRRDGNLWASVENRNYFAMRFRKGLVKHIRQIFRGPYFGPLAVPMFVEDFPRRPMGRLVAIKRDGARQSALALKRPPEKRFGCRDIPLGAE